LEFEVAVLRPPHIGTGQVGGQQVGRELDAGEACVQARGQCAHCGRLREPGCTLDQQVAIGQQCNQQPFDQRILAHDLGAQAFAQVAERGVQPAAVVVVGVHGANDVAAHVAPGWILTLSGGFGSVRNDEGAIRPLRLPATACLPVHSRERCETRITRGVTMISSSALLLLLPRFLNRLPMTGRSARNGTLDRSDWSRNSYTPPMTTVWPSSTSTEVVTWRVAICGTWPTPVCTKPERSSFCTSMFRNTRPSAVMVGVTFICRIASLNCTLGRLPCWPPVVVR